MGMNKRMKAVKRRIASARETLLVTSDVLRGEKMEDNLIVEAIERGSRQARVIALRPAVRERLKAAEMLGKRNGAFDPIKKTMAPQEDPLLKVLKEATNTPEDN